MYTPMRLSASGRTSSKIVAPPPKRPQVLTTEASMVFNPTKASKDKVPATFEIKGSTPAGSDDRVFLDLPQSPTASIRFNDLEWGDERNDWAPASTTLPATYKDSAFNHPPPGEPVTSSFLPSPHEKVWVQVGLGEAFAWGRLQRSKHKSFYHDHVSVFNPVNKTYHPLPNGFIPPQPGVIPSLNDLRRDAKLRRAERVDPPLSSPAPTTIPTIHSGTQATERRRTESTYRRGEPGLAPRMSQPITVPMPSLSFKPTEPGRGYQGRPSMEPSKLSSTDGPAPGSSIQPKKVAPLTESGKLGKPSSKAQLRNVTVTEEQDVDGSTVDPPLSKRHPSKVTITEERDVDAPPLEAKQTSSNAPILDLATHNEEDDEDLDALAPSVRAHKKGKFRSGRLSKRHFARAEKARPPQLIYRYDPEAPKRKFPLMKYTLIRYNREKEEHKDDLEAWHQEGDTPGSTHTSSARQVAAVKDSEYLYHFDITRPDCVTACQYRLEQTPRIQQKIDEEEVWVHESLRNMADAFNHLLDVGKLKDFFLHFLYILITNRVRCINWPLTSGVPERDFVGSKKFFSKIGMGDSDILSLGTAYFAEKPENMPVQFESWTDVLATKMMRVMSLTLFWPQYKPAVKLPRSPRSRAARHPVAISEDEEDNDDPVPPLYSQPPVAGQQVNPFQPNMPMAPSSFYPPQPMPDFNALFAQWMQTQAGAFAQSQTHGQFMQPATRSAPSRDLHFPGDDHNMQ
ncbi:hypothetical protein BKA70DRAFT_1219726 [Coprinopsis sp. MPI-PUGE-AT-0042]|nr:hypothetical protein BKA70DRAFT_1219726 [Coprinopsis sp. MPI-PUGE-AT-0042]